MSKLFKIMIGRVRRAIAHIEEAAVLLDRARLDDIPDDLRDLGLELEGLIESIELEIMKQSLGDNIIIFPRATSDSD